MGVGKCVRGRGISDQFRDLRYRMLELHGKL